METIENDGFIIIKNFFEKEKINDLLESSKQIFQTQFDYLNYDSDFKSNMIKLFNEHFDTFSNCGKMIQGGLIELYRLALDPSLINKIIELGVENPNMCTRPVLFFNHEKLAKEVQYYKTPLHQDWPSMLSSLNSLVVWVPLVDVDVNNGSIILYPGTHKFGPLNYSLSGGFSQVDEDYIKGITPIQPKMEVGDITIFSSLLVHKSGDILDDTIRWSCHFRYTDMGSKEFIERGYPTPYIYKSVVSK
jgi:phytanoyl-CoA hydroxylase